MSTKNTLEREGAGLPASQRETKRSEDILVYSLMGLLHDPLCSIDRGLAQLIIQLGWVCQEIFGLMIKELIWHLKDRGFIDPRVIKEDTRRWIVVPAESTHGYMDYMARTGQSTAEQGATFEQVEHIQGLFKKQLEQIPPDLKRVILDNDRVCQYFFSTMISGISRRLLDRDVVIVTVDYDEEPEAVFGNFQPFQKRRENWESLAKMPRGGYGRKQVRLEFFNLGVKVSHVKLERVRRILGFSRLASIYELAEANRVLPKYALKRRNVTHWQGREGNWYALIYDKSGETQKEVSGGYGLDVYPFDEADWFAGVVEG